MDEWPSMFFFIVLHFWPGTSFCTCVLIVDVILIDQHEQDICIGLQSIFTNL